MICKEKKCIKWYAFIITQVTEYRVNITFFLNYEGNGRILSYVYSTYVQDV